MVLKLQAEVDRLQGNVLCSATFTQLFLLYFMAVKTPELSK